MVWSSLYLEILSRRTPHGVRGLKYNVLRLCAVYASRTPHGVRGLKYLQSTAFRAYVQSHPSRGAWIEI